jgi:hypothetical protein
LSNALRPSATAFVAGGGNAAHALMSSRTNSAPQVTGIALGIALLLLLGSPLGRRRSHGSFLFGTVLGHYAQIALI